MLRLPTESWRTTWNEAACRSSSQQLLRQMGNVGVNLVIAGWRQAGSGRTHPLH